MGPSPNAVLSDIHQIASGVDTTVAVLGVLSNRKSRVCISGRRHCRPLTCPAALKDSTLPASLCVAEGLRSAQGCRHLPVSVWPEATAIPDSARPIVGLPARLCLRDSLYR